MIFYEEKDTRFYIKESTILEANKGLFAKEKIYKGDFLEISGVLVKRESIADLCTHYANNYKFAARVKRLANGKIDIGDNVIVPLGYAGIVNHAKDKASQNVEIRYIKRTKKNENSDDAVYYFLRDVDKDEEILGNYGDSWDSMLKWINESTKDQQCIEDWEKFLMFDLYNLGSLIKTV